MSILHIDSLSIYCFIAGCYLSYLTPSAPTRKSLEGITAIKAHSLSFGKETTRSRLPSSSTARGQPIPCLPDVIFSFTQVPRYLIWHLASYLRNLGLGYLSLMFTGSMFTHPGSDRRCLPATGEQNRLLTLHQSRPGTDACSCDVDANWQLQQLSGSTVETNSTCIDSRAVQAQLGFLPACFQASLLAS